MHHFAYRNGVLHAEAVDLSISRAVGTPFYCYSTATLERHYQVFAEAFAGVKTLVCYAMKANSNQVVLRTLAEARRRHGRGVRGRAQARAGGGVPPARSCSPASARPRTSCARRWRPASSASTSNPSPSSSCCREIAVGPARPRGSRSGSIPTSMPAPTPRSPPASPRTSSASRSSARARSMPARRAAGHRGDRRRHAYRQPDHRARAVRNAFALLSDLVETLRADGHDIEHIDLGGGLGIPYRGTTSAAASRGLCRDGQARTRDLGCTLIFEPGRMIVGNAGILVTRVLYVKRWRGQDLRHRRCGDERSDPPDALRGPARHPAGARDRQGRARIVGRRGRAGLRDRRLSRARPRLPRPQPAISSPS